MMRQGTFWAYNLRPPESERQRQANVHCSNIERAKTWKQKKVHKQMTGKRRSGIWTEWNSSLGKKMNNTVFRTTVEPRNNHITISKSKGYDKCPMISFIHVILRLLPMNIFPQKKTLTDLSNKLMVSQNERWGDG